MTKLTWNRNLLPELLNARSMAPPPPQIPGQSFEACASTASLLLYTQGPVILCLHHDTLAPERRFENHKEDITFISVDNVSERGQGRLVVSYDAGQTAIVWDLFTGIEIARFKSSEPLRVASWMRNGNVVFGNEKGEVILFEPSTSEQITTHTISDPITALAPGADCRNYAIGYQNGTILIATLHPIFDIIHKLTTSRGPSPLIGLAWHASSAKQKSDMLASQALNGDLRVWSVLKPPEKDIPRTIRVLKRSDAAPSGPQWMAWSKNGKIVQYMNGETYAWDVRTKNVSSERIPTIENVRGIANYGPTATLFTLGPNFTIQQYDLDNPSMVANVQRASVSSEDAIAPQVQDSSEAKETSSGSEGRQTPSEANSKASEKSQTTPFSPPKSGTSFASSASATEKGSPQPYGTPALTPSMKSSRAGSRLKNEIQFSPADKQLDLFPFARARLNDVPYGHHKPVNETNLTPDGLRQRMLNMVFGWDGDIQGLIYDEFSRHPAGSQSGILLLQWLGGSDTDEMVSMLSSGTVSYSDWMLLAFSQMNGQAQANKVGQAFVQKLLERGDIHTAATILLGIGDRNDAIEVYVSQNYFMEAILMTCLLTPTDWQRQSFLVQRWGEYVIPQSKQQLAIRCFTCVGEEPSEPWALPAAQHTASLSESARKSPVKSPEPAYPSPASIIPPHQRKPSTGNKTEAAATTPSLKLVTSFDSQSDPNLRFPGLKSDDQTPTNAPWITPIVESAVGESAFSPGGTCQFRSNGMQSLNQAMGSRSVTPGFRGRLPSIGETPIDVQPPTFPPTPFRKTGESAMTSDSEDQQDQSSQGPQEESLSLLPSARYDPEQEAQAHKPSPQTAVQAGPERFTGIKGLPSPAAGVFEALRDQSESRNGSRGRKPDGLQLHLQQNPSQSGVSDNFDRLSNTRSPPASSNSLHSVKTPSTGGRTIDNFIQSLDEANYYAQKHRDLRVQGHTRSNTDDSVGQNTSEARGRNEDRFTPRAMRSPSSPVPMSPEEAVQYSNTNRSRTRNGESRTRSGSKARRPSSRNSARRHNRSTSRNTSSRTSERDRSIDRDESPPSPRPMTPMDEALRLVTSDRERLRSHQRTNSNRGETRAGRRGRSSDSNNLPGRSRSRQASREHESADQEPAASNSNNTGQDENFLLSSKTFEAPSASMEETQEIPFIVDVKEQKRKELAAAELEARRLSLARNPSAPNIPFPGDIRSNLRSPPAGLYPLAGSPFGQRPQLRQRTPSNRDSQGDRSSSGSGSSRSGVAPGLPATPRAMRQAKYNNSPEEPVPDSTLLLSDARYQGEAERIGRSISVPVPESQPASIPCDLPTHPRYNPMLPRSRSTSRTRNIGHHRESSRELYSPGSGGGSGYFGNSPVAAGIEETLESALQRQRQQNQQALSSEYNNKNNNNNNNNNNPPILPELQHLNTPPPPPPPPLFSNSPPACASPRESSGTIDIAIDNENLGRLLPRAMTAGPTIDLRSSPLSSSSSGGAGTGTGAEKQRRRVSFEHNHRRGKSANESFTSKIKNLARMRSNSSRGLEGWGHNPPHEGEIPMQMPYESVQMVEGRI